MTRSKKDPRIKIILETITDIALGKGDVKAQPTGKNDELDAIMHGLKKLSKELRAKNVKIEQSIKLLEGITENATSVIYVKDLQGKYLLMNRQYGKVFNFEPSEFLGKTDYDIFPKKTADIFRKNDNAVAKQEQAEATEEVAPQDDGPHTYVSVKFPLFDEKGKVFATGGISTDITERKQAEENLTASKERFELALKSSEAGLWDWNVETGDVVFDERWAEMLGYTLDEVEPNVAFWEKIVHPDDMPEVMAVLTGHLEGKSDLYQTEHRCQTKSGKWKWILDTGKVVEWDNKKQPLRAVGTHIDITKKKQAEEELRKLSQATEQSPATVLMTDFDGNIEYVNPAFTETTGYTQEEALGKNPRILKSGVHGVEFYEELWDTITAGKVWRGEFCNRKKSGELYWESASISPLTDADGKITHYVAVKEDITQRMQAEAEIALARDYAESITTSISDALFVVNTDATIKSVNPATSTLLGYDEKELLGMPIGKLFAEEEEEEEFSQKVLSLFGNRLQNIIDTDLNRFYTLMDDAPIGGLQVNNRGVITRANPQICALFGYTEKEIVGQPIHILLPKKLQKKHETQTSGFMEKNESRKMGQDRILEGQHKDGTLIQVEVALVQVEIEGEKSVISLVRNAKQDTAWEFIKMTKFGKLFEEEEEEEEEEFFWDKSRMMVTKKGRLIPVLVSGSLMRSKSGEIQRIVLGAKDISQRQQMERELAESEERYRELYHRAPVMYHSISPDGIIRDCNQTELDTLGYDRNEYVGKPLMDFIAPRQRNKMQSAITTAIKKGKIEAETRFIRKNDSQIPVLVNAVWQYDDGGKPLFSRTMMFDISERKRFEDELFQAEKMATVGQLAAGVAHKMRNPLAIISSTAQMGKSKVEDSEQFYEIFNVIQRNAAEANNMVYELLNFAKPRVLNKKKNTLRKTLDRTYDLIKGDFTKNNIRFIKEYSHSRKKAVYDEDSLIEIVLNLYMNAIQAMQKGGAIKTSLDQMDGNMCIHIEDNGPGIKEEHQMQVFDPYFTTKDKGTGLGLTLCHQLINQQNGLITIQSKEGSGTRFSLFLPKEIGGGGGDENEHVQYFYEERNN